MAQIGIPPAGWYTDPSGQHHARYWDGTAWTEDVRDDLAASGAATAPAAPSVNPVADTVASVAEAVAAVAANDVVTPTSVFTGDDPPLVVDYGTDDPWSAGSPIGPDSSVTGPVAAVADPFAGPALEPITSPVPAGPAPGWYPDPSSRHQARFWDGTRWSERVVDHGQEGIDPLPGLAPTATAISWTNTDPGSAEASSAQIGDPVPATSGWTEHLPTMSSEGAAVFGNDGAPMTAGQISLASLPATEEAEPELDRHSVRPTVKVRVAGGFVLAGAVALLAGSATTWIEVSGPRVAEHWTATGVDLGDGRITVVLALVLALLGAVLVTGRLARFGGAKVAAMGALVAGAAATAVTAVDIADVADRATRLGVPAGAVTNVGTGLWLAFVGALFAVGGGLMAFANRQ